MDASLQNLLTRAEALFSQGRWDEVDRLAREAVGRGMSHPLIFALMGITFAKRGNPELAQQALEAACAGKGPEVMLQVVRCMRSLLEPDLAEAVRQGLARRFPQESVFAASLTSDHGFPPAPSALGAWPYMNEIEVKATLAALRVLGGPLQALEWGGGHSTYFYARRLPAGSIWNSLEHDRTWFATLEAQANPSEGATIKLNLVPNSVPIREGIDDGDLQSFPEYIRFPRGIGGEFRFILVDGRARVECLLEGWNLLARDGIMVLHDAERPEYRPGHPAVGFRLEVSNPSLLEPKAIHFFTKTEETFQALSRALRESLPHFASLVPGMPRDH